jgi:predicted nucleic acid-binding protein
MPYLVDANVLCESSKAHPEPGVLKWLADHDAELHVSVLSLGEMLKGIHLMDEGNRRHEIERWYQRIDANSPSWIASSLPPPFNIISPSSPATPPTSPKT